MNEITPYMTGIDVVCAIRRNNSHVIEGKGQIYIKPPSNLCMKNGNFEGGGVWNPGSYISLFFDRSIGINMYSISFIACFSAFLATLANVLTYLSTQRRNSKRETANSLVLAGPVSYAEPVALQLDSSIAVISEKGLKTGKLGCFWDNKLEGACPNFFVFFHSSYI